MLSLLLSVLLQPAAAGFLVEGTPHADKADAGDEAKDVKAAGFKGRVVRRFREGAGWEYVVRVEDIGTSPEAFEAQSAMGTASGRAYVVYDERGQRVERTGAVTDEPSAPEKEVDTAWLDRALEAHGDVRDELAEAADVQFVFVKRFPDGRAARHTFVRSGTNFSLNIHGIDGAIENSRTVAKADAAWLEVGGERSTQDLQRSRETIAKFAPTAIVPLVLDLSRTTVEHPEFGKLVHRGSAMVGEEKVDVYGGTDDATLVAVDKKGRIRRVGLDGDQRIIEFADYRKLGDGLVPYRISTFVDGKPRDVVEVEKLEAGRGVDPSSFE